MTLRAAQRRKRRVSDMDMFDLKQKLRRNNLDSKLQQLGVAAATGTLPVFIAKESALGLMDSIGSISDAYNALTGDPYALEKLTHGRAPIVNYSGEMKRLDQFEAAPGTTAPVISHPSSGLAFDPDYYKFIVDMGENPRQEPQPVLPADWVSPFTLIGIEEEKKRKAGGLMNLVGQ